MLPTRQCRRWLNGTVFNESSSLEQESTWNYTGNCCTLIIQTQEIFQNTHLWIYSIYIHSFIQDISIVPHQVDYYSEVLPTTALILCRSWHTEVPKWWLEWDSNLWPSGRKAPNLPLSHHAHIFMTYNAWYDQRSIQGKCNTFAKHKHHRLGAYNQNVSMVTYFHWRSFLNWCCRSLKHELWTQQKLLKNLSLPSFMMISAILHAAIQNNSSTQAVIEILQT